MREGAESFYKGPLERLKCLSALRLDYALTALAILVTLSCDPPKRTDDLSDLMRAIRTQDWMHVKSHLAESVTLEEAPFYQAMKRGAEWHRLVRIRRIDHHLLVEVELMLGSQDESVKNTGTAIRRYMFWVTEPNTYDEHGPERAIGKLVGWMDPIPSEGEFVELTEISAPMRFATTSYRELSSHQDQSRLADFTLGVIGKEGSGAVESGWRGEIRLLNLDFTPIDSKSAQLCKKLKSDTVKRVEVLKHNLNQSCEVPLLLAAQRARYVNLNKIFDKVDVSKGGGGQEIRRSQDQELIDRFLKADQEPGKGDKSQSLDDLKTLGKQLPLYNGTLKFYQSLELSPEQRLAPELKEAILISPPLVSCIKGIIIRWSKDFLKRSPCRYQAMVHVKVEESDQ